MGRFPCCDGTSQLKKGPWAPEEDEKLTSYIQKHGHGSWQTLPKASGLKRCGKSCRLRWNNYLRPDIKRGRFTQEEEDLIINLHSVLGNKWSRIATHLSGRTDNEIKNYWNTHIRKKLLNMGIDPITHKPRTDLSLLANLSHLLSTPPNYLASSINPWDVNNILGSQPYLQEIAKLQLLQNIFQIINTNNNNSIPINDQNIASNFGGFYNINGLISNNINPSTCLASQETNISSQHPSYEGGLSNNNCISMNSVLDENRLPSLVSPSPQQTSTINQIDDHSNTHSTTNGSSALTPSTEDDLFEGLEKLLDDGDSDSFWHQFLR